MLTGVTDGVIDVVAMKCATHHVFWEGTKGLGFVLFVYDVKPLNTVRD